MKKSLCKRSYRQTGNLALEDRADGVKNGIYSNVATFATPTTTQAILVAALTIYTSTRKTHEQGGIAQQPAFTAARKALLVILDNLANYVDGVALGNAEIVKLAGFEATNDDTITAGKAINTNPATPQNVTFKRIENQSGQMVAECELYPGTCNYITLLTENNPLPAGVVVDANGNISIPQAITNAVSINVDTKRKKLFKGLKTGSTYYVYYVVINSKGASGMSDGKSMLCG